MLEYAMRSLLIVVTVLWVLAGCERSDPRNAEAGAGKPSVIRLEFWTPFSGGDNQFMTEMVDRFNAVQTMIQVVQVNSRLDDYYSRLRTAILAGNAPDVAIIHTTSLPQFVRNGYIEDLTKPAEAVELDWSIFNQNILESTVYDGQSYAVPLDTHALVMYYNKKYLRLAGLLDHQDKPMISPGPEGFREFLDTIKRAVPDDIAPMAQPSTRIDSAWLWWSLYNQMADGGAFYSEDGKASILNNPQAVEALTFVNDLYQHELIPPNINDAFKMFYDDKAAVLITGMWGTGAFENNQALDIGIVPMPVLYDQPAVWGDSHTLALPIRHDMTDDKREAVVAFAKWIVEHGEMWAKAGHVPSVLQVLNSDEFKAMKYRREFAEAANHVSYWPRYDNQWTTVEQIIIQEFEKMIYKQQSPEEALENAVNLINQELAG